MTKATPYLDYTFPGVTSFIELLDQTLTSYRIYQHESTVQIFNELPDLLDREKDSLVLGSCTRDNQTVFFAEFSLGISNGIASNIVFIYDHFPNLEELKVTALDLEKLTVEALKEKHGDTINDLERLDEFESSQEEKSDKDKFN